MPRQVYIEPGIQDLVRGLNQIQGTETLGSCDGHGGSAFISFACSSSVGIAIFQIAIEHKDIIIGKFSPLKPEPDTTYLSISLNPRWTSKTLLEMQYELLEDLKKNGLITKECPFEILTPLSITEIKEKWEPDFQKFSIAMTVDRFESIKSFLCVKWCKRLEFSMDIKFLPNLSGDIESGEFYGYISYKRCLPHTSTPVNFSNVLWDVRWREHKIIMSLHEHDYNNPFNGYSIFEIQCLENTDSIQFNDDGVKTLIKILLRGKS